MTTKTDFDISEFLPYLLNQAADKASLGFRDYYKSKYGMLTTEWRVLFHLGRYGTLTAKQICDIARIHKTKVSRAVHALESKRFLTRDRVPEDRRNERLTLTRSGLNAYRDIVKEAEIYEQKLFSGFDHAQQVALKQHLKQITDF